MPDFPADISAYNVKWAGAQPADVLSIPSHCQVLMHCSWVYGDDMHGVRLQTYMFLVELELTTMYWLINQLL